MARRTGITDLLGIAHPIGVLVRDAQAIIANRRSASTIAHGRMAA